MPGLVLGPIVRYVEDRVATIWLQADAACEVDVLGVRERTWCVDRLHFALVAVEGLAACEDHPYEARGSDRPALATRAGRLITVCGPPVTVRARRVATAANGKRET